jgi:hypothetical protein
MAKFILDENLNMIYRNPFSKDSNAPSKRENPDNVQSASSHTVAAGTESQKESNSGSYKAMDTNYNFFDLDKNSLLKGIILSEILGKPRAKRGFRR